LKDEARMRTLAFIAGFVTAVAASSAFADEAAANVPLGTLAATASREIGQATSVVQVPIDDPREQAAGDDEDRARAANAERSRLASERDPSLIPLAP
jgi:hypothetical protein